MTRSLIRSTLLAAAIACSPLALAAGAPPASGSSTGAAGHMWMHGGHRGGHHMDGLAKLDLNDAQRTKIKELRKQNFEKQRTATQSLHQQRMAFAQTLPGNAGYQKATNQLAKAESDAARERVLQQAELQVQIYHELTPAQRTRWAELRQQRAGKMQQWRDSRRTRSAGSPASATSSP